MNQPLGLAIGNILEVKEAIDTLHGNGPRDFTELCYSSGTTMLLQAGLYKSDKAARSALENSVSSGKAFAVFKNFVKAQGGDVSYIDDPSKFPIARYMLDVRSLKSGYISEINTMELGLTSMRIGAGRETKDDVIDPAAGILLRKKLGDRVSKGDILLTLYSERPELQNFADQVLNYFDLSSDPVEVPSVVEEEISLSRETGEFVVSKE